jgi:hypothetical protein
LTHPWLAFTERGYDVAIFSPKGGKCAADALSDPRDPSGYSDTDLISLGFISTPKLRALGPIPRWGWAPAMGPAGDTSTNDQTT